MEDIGSRSFKFSLMIFKLVGILEVPTNYRFLLNQLLRSSTSIGANIVEGKSSSSRKELTRYYQISLKSANETNYWLRLLKEGLNLDQNLFAPVLDELDQICKILAKTVISLKSVKSGS